MKLPRRLPVPGKPHGTGGRAEFEGGLARDFPALVGQLYAITLNARAAREHVEDAYAEAWRQWSVIRHLPDPASWVRTAAIGYSRAWVRRAGQRARAAPEGPWPPTAPGSRALFDALGALAEDGRRCLVLYHVVGLPVDVIATIEQVAVADVHARLAGSYDKLLGGIREAVATRSGTAGKGGSGAERVAAVSAWDEDKSAALRTLVAELASSVDTPGVSTIVRRAGSQNRATSAAAIAVLAVGALGGVTIAVSAIGEPAAGTPTQTAIAAPPTTAPVLLPAEPLATPTPTRTRSPIARPRATARPVATTTPTPTSTTTTPTQTSESTATAEPAPTTPTSSAPG